MAKRKAGSVADPVMGVDDVLRTAGVNTGSLTSGLERFGKERDKVLMGRDIRSTLAHDPLVGRVRCVLDVAPSGTLERVLREEGFFVESTNGCVRIDFEEMRITVSRARAIEIAALAMLLSAYRVGR